jgi:hypothetical protein
VLDKKDRTVPRSPFRQQARHIALGDRIVAPAQAGFIQARFHINDQQRGVVSGRCHARVSLDANWRQDYHVVPLVDGLVWVARR